MKQGDYKMRIRRACARGAAVLSITALAGLGLAAQSADASPSTPAAALHVVASGLNQPHGLTVGANGDIYVAEVGNSKVGAGCKNGTERACVNNSGSIARITPGGKVKTLVRGLPEVGQPGGDPGSAGVAAVWTTKHWIYGIIQNTNIAKRTGKETYGPKGRLLGDLVRAPISGGAATKVASLGPYEAKHNPDQGAGTGPGDPAIDSDPYDVVAYHGGEAVADAAGNDVLWVSPSGHISTLAVLPLVKESTKGGSVKAQPVPTSLAVGPDGDLYIGELGGGAGSDVGDVNVYRLAHPGGALHVFARHLTMIGSLAFDHSGRLLVLEIDTKGLDDPSSGLPAPGAIIRINKNGSKTTVAEKGLEYPLGIAVAKSGAIYTTNYGVLPGKDGPIPGLSGQVVRVG
jgi:hypothetical protein